MRIDSGVQVLALAGLWLALGGMRAAWANPASAADAISRIPASATVKVAGDVSQEPILEATGRLLMVDVHQVSQDGGTHWQAASGTLEAYVGGPDDWFAPAYGDAVQLTGKVLPISSGAPAGVLARMTALNASIVARGGGSPIFAWLFNVRVKLAQGIQRSLPEPEAALLIGILLGLKTPVLRARLSLFTATGTIHLVVPAGLKVSMLADLSRRATAMAGLRVSTAVSLATVALYAALGGGGPAAARAAIMGALLVLAPVFGRRYDVLAALSVATFAMTAIEPGLLFDVSFQLTVLATLGIPLFTPYLEQLALRATTRVPFGDALRPLVTLVAVTVAAQLATLPVIAQIFGIISFIAPLANLLVVPLLTPLLLLGGLVALLVLTWPSVAWLGGLAVWPLLWVADRAIEACARAPGASLAVASPSPWLTWIYYGALATAFAGITVWQRRAGPTVPGPQARVPADRRRGDAMFRAGLVLMSLAVLAGVWSVSPAIRDPVNEVDALAVGAGGWATLVRLSNGTTVLIDGGASGPMLDLALASKLPFWQRHLSVLALTDPGTGTEPGLQDALAHFTVDHAVDMGVLHPTTVYLAWLDTLRQNGVPRTQLREGDVIQLGHQEVLRVLAPPAILYPDHGGTTTESNNMILRLELPGLRMLLLGNADAFALDALASSGQPLAADVVEVARPRLVIVDQAPRPPGRHTSTGTPGVVWPPDAPTGQSLGATIVRLSSVGSITLRADSAWQWRYQ